MEKNNLKDVKNNAMINEEALQDVRGGFVPFDFRENGKMLCPKFRQYFDFEGSSEAFYRAHVKNCAGTDAALR